MFGLKKVWEELHRQSKHIATINDELGVIQKQTEDIPVIRNNIKWIAWLVCAVFLAVAVGLLQQFFGIFGI